MATMNDGTIVPGYEGDDVKYYTHVNYYTMKKALELLEEQKLPSYTIVETGCASHGTKSTLLWDSFVQKHGGQVFSVDLDKPSVDTTNKFTSSQCIVACSDSVKYLKHFNSPIDFLYLDSYDVNFLQPGPAALHHWREFQAVKHLLHPGSIVLIADTPLNYNWLDNGVHHPCYGPLSQANISECLGKGMFVRNELLLHQDEEIMHQYQTLWRVRSTFSKSSLLA